MAPPAGLEPAPARVEVACPIQLGDGGDYEDKHATSKDVVGVLVDDDNKGLRRTA